jgi:TonB family protein
VQPWALPKPSLSVLAVTNAPAETAASEPKTPPAGSRPAWTSPRAWLGIAAAGVVVRGGWLALGLVGLGRLRRRGRRLSPEPPLLASALERIGVRAAFYSSAETPVPVTFGLRRPAVLLPDAVLSMEPQALQAILYHELLHVRRRDWAVVVVEEAVRALLWFHPAVAWLVGRIHLCREQVVDRAVVAMTEARDEYVGALLEVAKGTVRPEPMPAALFLRASRLRQRVAEILKEGGMSRGRLLFHVAACIVAVLAAAGVGVRWFPLVAAAAEAQGKEPVEVVRGAENVLHRAPVAYPRRAFEKRVEGDVVVDLTLDEEGHVQDARVASGPDELRAAALESVLRWHFSEPRSGATQVAIRFRLPAEGELLEKPMPVEKPKRVDVELKRRPERQIEELEQALKDRSLAAEQREKYAHLLAERQAEQEALALDAAKLGRTLELEQAVETKRRADVVRTERQIEELEQAVKDRNLGAQQREQYAQMLAERQVSLNLLTANMAELAQRQERIVELQRAAGEEEWRLKEKIVELKSPPLAREPLEGTLAEIHLARLSEGARRQLLAQLGVAVGDPIDASVAERVQENVRRFDEHLKVVFSRGERGIVLLIVAP